MITEDYVSYEVAKLLKENGFNEKCEYCYAYFDDNDIRVFEFLKPNKKTQNLAENRYPYVTHQMAMKWLREVYKIYIDIETCYTYINKNENFEVTGYEFTIHSQYEPCYEDHETYNSYEKAVEAALKYILENLI